MASKNDQWYPKTKKDFEAYCKAVDAANKAVVANATKRDQKAKSTGSKPKSKK